MIKVLVRPFSSSDIIYDEKFEYKIKVGEISAFNFNHTRLKIMRPQTMGKNSLSFSTRFTSFNLGRQNLLQSKRDILPIIDTKNNICFDTEKSRLIQPSKANQRYLKKGDEIHFKVKAIGVIAVYVVDGGKMVNLKNAPVSLNQVKEPSAVSKLTKNPLFGYIILCLVLLVTQILFIKSLKKSFQCNIRTLINLCINTIILKITVKDITYERIMCTAK